MFWLLGGKKLGEGHGMALRPLPMLWSWWWPFFAFCDVDVEHMCYHTMTSVLTVRFVSLATRNNVTKRQLDQEPQRINFTLWPQNNRLKEDLVYGRAFYSSLCKSPLSWISIAQKDCRDKSWKFNHQLLQPNICLHWLFQKLLFTWKAPLSACVAEVTQTTPLKL